MLEDTTELIRVDAHDIHVASLQWIIDIAAFHVDLHMIRILSSDGRTVYFEGGIRAVRKVIRK